MFNVDDKTIDKENDGVWAPFKGSKFLIASSGSTKFQRLFTKLQMPHRRDIDKKRLDPEIQVDIMCKAMSKAIVLDWDNVVDNSGNLVTFSIDNAYRALKNNAEFREFVTDYSTELENYATEEREDMGKSVEKSSDGKQNLENEKSS
jgi:hypothetical protein